MTTLRGNKLVTCNRSMNFTRAFQFESVIANEVGNIETCNKVNRMIISDYVDKRRRPNDYIVRSTKSRGLMAKQESNEKRVYNPLVVERSLFVFSCRKEREEQFDDTTN